MTSSERSLRLCAFSVFRARICHATSRSGTTRAVMDLAPRRRMASRRCRPLGVPEASAGRDDSDDRVEKTSCLMKYVGQPLVVSAGEVTLKRRRLDLVDGEN